MTARFRLIGSAFVVLWTCGLATQAAQPPGVPPSVPPPPPPAGARAGEETDRQAGEEPGEDAGDATPIVDPDAPWKISDDLLAPLARQAEVYRDYALRFTCSENARVAHYDESNEASRESNRRYSYLLERDAAGGGFREYRETLKTKQKSRDVEATGHAVDDEERFPPAYAWVFLFAKENQPYFMYRSLGERFEGFDWVHEIQFRGALPFTDGRDIRQWEGTVLMDAVTYSPLEIRAEPSAQMDRIRALFDQWSRSFNLAGIRFAPRPFGYRCRVTLGFRKDKLSFPTELRYDTFRAVGAQKFVPWMASVRVYDGYRFFKTETEETPGKPATR